MAGMSALLLIALFLGAIYGFNKIEYDHAQVELQTALKEAELAANKAHGLEVELSDAVRANPELSVSVFEANTGDPISTIGNQRPPLITDESTFGDVAGVPVLLRRYAFRVNSAPATDYVAVASLSWKSRAHALEGFATFLIPLWFGLVGLIAAIAWNASRSTFEPLERLAGQAEAMSTHSLSARLDIEPGEYGDFAKRLNRFLERIEMSVRREEQFVADAAHELRTPLTVMRGTLETSLMRTRTAGEYKDSLRHVLGETERLAGLVEMLLQSASQVEGPVDPLDLESQSERAHARWVDRYAEHGVQLELSAAPSTARVKPRELEVVVDNLLSNALKVSRSGDHCQLSVESDGQRSKVHVADEGPGVPPQYAESIFERLTRLDQGRNRDKGGFGIGLAVCRRIVEGRGGNVYLAPSEKGAHFVIELPA